VKRVKALPRKGTFARARVCVSEKPSRSSHPSRGVVPGGLPDVAAVRDATSAYLRDEDVLGQFFDAELVFASDCKVARREVRERYVRWAEERDERPVGPKVLAEALRRRGVIERKVHTTAGKRDGWAGVRLATEADERASGDTWGGRGDE